MVLVLPEFMIIRVPKDILILDFYDPSLKKRKKHLTKTCRSSFLRARQKLPALDSKNNLLHW